MNMLNKEHSGQVYITRNKMCGLWTCYAWIFRSMINREDTSELWQAHTG